MDEAERATAVALERQYPIVLARFALVARQRLCLTPSRWGSGTGSTGYGRTSLRLWYAADVAEAATRIPDVPCANGGLRQNVNRQRSLMGFALSAALRDTAGQVDEA